MKSKFVEFQFFCNSLHYENPKNKMLFSEQAVVIF